MPNYMPTTNNGLLSFTKNLSAIWTSSPAAVGLSVGQAESYATAQGEYATRLAASQAPETRGVSTCFAMRTARATLVVLTRQFVRIVQSCPLVSDQQRVDMDIPVPKTHLTRGPAPALGPTLTVENVKGRTFTYRVSDAARPTSRARPANAVAVTIMTYAGDVPPPEGDPGWVYQVVATRNPVTVVLGDDVLPGTKVWAVAFWNGTRGQTSAACDPVPAYVQFTTTSAEAAAKSPRPQLKAA